MTRHRIARLQDLLGVVLAGLSGTPFSWGDGARRAWCPLLASAGVDLLSKTGIEARGHRLKRGAKPVGKAYFGAPLKRTAPLYVLHVQTVEGVARRTKRGDQLPLFGGPAKLIGAKL